MKSGVDDPDPARVIGVKAKVKCVAWQKIKAYLDHMGMTPADLARMCPGVTPPFLSDLKNGKGGMTAEKALMLKRGTGLPTDYWIDPEVVGFHTPSGAISALSEEDREILKIAARMPEGEAMSRLLGLSGRGESPGQGRAIGTYDRRPEPPSEVEPDRQDQPARKGPRGPR